MKTSHALLIRDARQLAGVPDASVHLVVTSPPYPMIEMWDGTFAEMNPAVSHALHAECGSEAFELMHAELDCVWAECCRVLTPGGLLCVNVGDATRSIGGDFQLFSNHARIIAAGRRLGLTVLPDILWRKPTNAPNKFMGSGMLPAGAYVTYEHEYILIFRKGARRAFISAEDKGARRRSAYFWEERNAWFSDVWTDLPGTRQALGEAAARARSAAFPFELPYRLIQMFSVQGDTVLDPFAGVGTTMAAALASGRNGIGVERDPVLGAGVPGTLAAAVAAGTERVVARLRDHGAFVARRVSEGRPPSHGNAHHGVPVVTSQETDLTLLRPTSLERSGPHRWTAVHEAAGRIDTIGATSSASEKSANDET